jgi:3-oxoacyl-[acyl-carrier protein] reductase
MIPDGIAPEARSRLLDPAIMVPPLLWLASPAADQVTGDRFVATLWDSSLPPEQASERARSRAGWTVPIP